jgi:predicted permease
MISVEQVISTFAEGSRSILRNRGGTIWIVATLTVGFMAVTIFGGIAISIFARELPIPDPHRAVAVLSATRDRSREFPSAPGVVVDLRERTRSFDRLAGVRRITSTVVGTDGPARLDLAVVSPEYFDIVGGRALAGRLLAPTDADRGAAKVALLGERYWRRIGAPSLIGKTIVIDGIARTVVGIVPPMDDMIRPERPDAWIPLEPTRAQRAGGDVLVVARLRTGVSIDMAREDVERVMAGIRAESRPDAETFSSVRPLRDWVVREGRRPVTILVAAASLLMLACAVNAGHFLLLRTAGRRRDLAIRAAIGASRNRIIAMVAVECLILTMAAATAGFILASAGLRILVALPGVHLPRVEEIGIGSAGWLLACFVALTLTVVLGFANARATRRTDLTQDLRVASPIGLRLGVTQVMAISSQVAAAVVMASASAALLRATVNLLSRDLGFDRNGLYSVSIDLPRGGDSTGNADLYRAVVDGLRARAGVIAVASADAGPLEPVRLPFTLGGGDRRETMKVFARRVGPGYFGTMRTALVAGREFRQSDADPSVVPVVIGRSVAARMFGGNPIGQRITTDDGLLPSLEVIGVAGDVNQFSMSETTPSFIYLPLEPGSESAILVRAGIPGDTIAHAAWSIIRPLAPAAVPPRVTGIEARTAELLARPRLYLVLLTSAAVVAVLLAVSGVFGLMSRVVSARRAEFGVRMALGASPGRIAASTLRSGIQLIVPGLVVGVPLGFAVATRITSVVPGISSSSPWVPAAAATIVAGAALLATLLPAKAAAAVDPLSALKAG